MGSWSPLTRWMASSMKRLDPTPAVPSTSRVPASPAVAAWRTAASRAKASSRPTNRALVYLPAMVASYTAGPRGHPVGR